MKTSSLAGGRCASMSGGNQQKVVIAKWLARGGRLLIVDEPTRGVDVGAKAAIHHLLDELAGQGVAIMLIFVGVAGGAGNLEPRDRHARGADCGRSAARAEAATQEKPCCG